MFSPHLRERLHEAGATLAEQAQAIGILQSYVQTGDTPQFDAQQVQQVIANGTSAYLLSFRTTMLVMAALVALVAALCFWVLARRTTRAVARSDD